MLSTEENIITVTELILPASTTENAKALQS